jgi:UDP-N-acetylglucosamine 2-epimerase (non-hydrolysing)
MTEVHPTGALRPVMCIVGARPNYMKMAPILRALAAHRPALPHVLIHTGQHYDREMNDQLFDDLELPRPDVNLGVGSGTHAVQTAEVMLRFEPELERVAPSCVLVVGDVNSTLACSLVAVKRGVPVGWTSVMVSARVRMAGPRARPCLGRPG